MGCISFTVGSALWAVRKGVVRVACPGVVGSRQIATGRTRAVTWLLAAAAVGVMGGGFSTRSSTWSVGPRVIPSMTMMGPGVAGGDTAGGCSASGCGASARVWAENIVALQR